MEFTIFDTSVWVNFSKGIQTRETQLLESYLLNDPVYVLTTPTILQEYLMGLPSESKFNRNKVHLRNLICLEDNWLSISISAAKLYFDLRKKGITIRKSNDCLIAQVAIENNVLLVHNDRDFELIASVSSLRTY